MNILPDNFRLHRYGLDVRFVTEDDAPFIVNLRTNPDLSKFLHPISSDIEKQKEWIRSYKQRQAEGKDYYFVFSKDMEPLGLERIYDIQKDSFTHGSLVFKQSSPIGMSVLADIITREIAFEELGLQKNHFDVRKGNVNVRNYHLKYKPLFIRSDAESDYYLLERNNFEKYKNLFLKLFI